MTEIRPDIRILREHALFTGFSEAELRELMSVLRGRFYAFERGERLNDAFDRSCPHAFFYLLGGSLVLGKYDGQGNQVVLDFAWPGYLLGYYGVLTPASFEELHIVASAPGQILFFDPEPLRLPLGQTLLLARLEKNMMRLLAQHSWQLMKKTEILSSHTLRKKILAFLSAQRERCGSSEFDLPMSRRTLADYLYVNPSALSRELGRLKQEGVLDFRRNHFRLKD